MLFTNVQQPTVVNLTDVGQRRRDSSPLLSMYIGAHVNFYGYFFFNFHHEIINTYIL